MSFPVSLPSGIRSLGACALLMSLVLSGCLGADTPSTTEVGTDDVPLLVDALLALDNQEPVANIERLGAFQDGNAQELDAWGDYVAIMQNPKMRILNVSNPEDPVLESEMTFLGVKDVKFSHDGNYLFIGNDGGLTDPAALPTSQAGFYVVDVHDKANPANLTFLKVDGRRGPHMVFYHQTTDGRELVMGANADISINEFDRAAGTLTELSRYTIDAVTDYNRAYHVIDPLYQGWAHDMSVMEDPIENKTLMYVAHWDAGLRIVDLSDPSTPKEIGKWDDWGADQSGNLHTVATDWVGDRRITVGSPELGFQVVGGYHYYQGTEKNGVYVWDTTDPSNIKTLAFWNHPDARCTYAERGADEPYRTTGETETSSHNLQFEAGRVYLAHYTCGVIVLDLASRHGGSLDSPLMIGYDKDIDNTWDVILHRGMLIYGDGSGVLLNRFVLDEVGPEGLMGRA